MIKSLLLALMLIVTPAFAFEANLESEAALVRITFNDEEGDAHLCSGSHLGNGVILTAAHCVGDDMVATDELYPARVLWADRDYDVALLYVPELSMAPRVTLTCGELPIGTEVEALGIPFGYGNVHTFGRVANRPVRVSGRRVHWEVAQFTTLLIEGGMSGGMVLDSDGRQVGLIVGTYHNIGIIVPASALCALMGHRL